MCIAWGATASRGGAQSWRTDAAYVGTTARVLIVGARPDDEDNALIAWLSLSRHVETAYLSLTRGESGENVSGEERGAPLAVVRRIVDAHDGRLDLRTSPDGTTIRITLPVAGGDDAQR